MGSAFHVHGISCMFTIVYPRRSTFLSLCPAFTTYARFHSPRLFVVRLIQTSQSRLAMAAWDVIISRKQIRGGGKRCSVINFRLLHRS